MMTTPGCECGRCGESFTDEAIEVCPSCWKEIDELDRETAAPDLLAALESCVHLCERDSAHNQSTEYAAGADARLERVRAAIEKAKQ